MVVPFLACASAGGKISQDEAAHRSQITTAEQLLRLQRSPEYQAWVRKKKGCRSLMRKAILILLASVLVMTFASSGLVRKRTAREASDMAEASHAVELEQKEEGSTEDELGNMDSYAVELEQKEGGSTEDELGNMDCKGDAELPGGKLLVEVAAGSLPAEGVADLLPALSFIVNSTTSMDVCWLEESPFFKAVGSEDPINQSNPTNKISKKRKSQRQVSLSHSQLWKNLILWIPFLTFFGVLVCKAFFSSNRNLRLHELWGKAGSMCQFRTAAPPHQTKMEKDETPELEAAEFAELERNVSESAEKESSRNGKATEKIIGEEDPAMSNEQDAELEGNRSAEFPALQDRRTVQDLRLAEARRRCNVLEKSTSGFAAAQTENERLKTVAESSQIVRLRCKNKEKKLASLKTKHEKAVMQQIAMEADLLENTHRGAEALGFSNMEGWGGNHID